MRNFLFMVAGPLTQIVGSLVVLAYVRRIRQDVAGMRLFVKGSKQ